ncbi:MAG: DnaJ domain-containing protein [Eubacteriales bacterium]|nr:DnaJ domain-containing protein [Eubacteriales bacterium]MDD4105040.1 DnaJ domain-containing protein [Eubacteriales bacterium]MDD4711554.1 DnaJ domain-containing protein [Eubacteriales bacterium]NLO15030.1 DnaJ domain-containing protein [Clostridiales bacterium]
MGSAFEVLGIAPTDDKQAVRCAYHTLVKKYHPDRFTDPGEQAIAQQRLIELNLAYEKAIKLTEQRTVGFHTVPAQQAKAFARRLLEQMEPESALRQLARADGKDEEWYYLEGLMMMQLRQWAAAHQSFREAVRRSPENMTYRRAALNAALAVKRNGNVVFRVIDWCDNKLKRSRRS